MLKDYFKYVCSVLDPKLLLPLVFLCKQSMPRKGLLSLTCLALTSVMVWMGFRPLFSAKAIGMTSKASANERMAYCSNDGH